MAGSKVVPELVYRARCAFPGSREAFARHCGVSIRTLTRWQSGESTVWPKQMAAIVELVHPHDRALAQEIATYMGQTLQTLGLEAPSPPAPVAAASPHASSYAVTASHLAGTVLCAAAEAMNVPPAAIRPALVAALKTMRELGLGIHAAEAALAEKTTPTS
jgi:hypothetical protein